MIKESRKDRLFSGVITVILIILAVAAFIPLLSEISISFSSKAASDMNAVNLLPVEFTIDSWKYMLTKGGPGQATETVSYYAYKVGFSFFDVGHSSAICIIILVVVTVICQILNKYMADEWEV